MVTVSGRERPASWYRSPALGTETRILVSQPSHTICDASTADWVLPRGSLHMGQDGMWRLIRVFPKHKAVHWLFVPTWFGVVGFEWESCMPSYLCLFKYTEEIC
ncbi:hypothetical protein MTO96_008819 [Rhipicephalus appendiculatus]